MIPNGILLCVSLAPSHTENVYAVSEREIVLDGKETRGNRKRIDWNEKKRIVCGNSKNNKMACFIKLQNNYHNKIFSYN